MDSGTRLVPKELKTFPIIEPSVGISTETR